MNTSSVIKVSQFFDSDTNATTHNQTRLGSALGLSRNLTQND